MNSIKFFPLFLAITLLLAGCEEETIPSPCDLLIGNWECISWTADDYEFLGQLIEYSYLDLDEIDLSGKGDHNWVVKNTDGLVDHLDGAYSTNTSCNEIYFDLDNAIQTGGGTIEFNFQLNEEVLTIEGFNAGYYQVITFKRK